ncbi:MAG: glycosyltransferase [Bacillales bacterium]
MHLLVEACERIPEAKLTLVGSGPLEPKLRRLANPEKVTFAGVVPNRHLPAVLQRAQVFVLPSQYEGTPKALLEAMACEVPSIGTNIGGIPEVIVHGETGYLVELGDVKRAAEYAVQLLTDEEKLASFRKAAYERAANVFHSRYIVKQYTDLYQRLLSENQGEKNGENRQSGF